MDAMIIVSHLLAENCHILFQKFINLSHSKIAILRYKWRNKAQQGWPYGRH